MLAAGHNTYSAGTRQEAYAKIRELARGATLLLGSGPVRDGQVAYVHGDAWQGQLHFRAWDSRGNSAIVQYSSLRG